jgi:hypothetical protein
VNLRHYLFSMAHQWRKPICAVDAGALSKNVGAIELRHYVFPTARQWRNGAQLGG